jgi:hypothetical protein
LIPQLEQTLPEYRRRERVLVPLVSKGNRAGNLLAALQALGEVRAGRDWFVYLADAESYYAGRAPAVSATPPTAGGVAMSADVPPIPPEFPCLLDSSSVRPLQGLIVGGYTSFDPVHPYLPVRKIVHKLNRNVLFEGVDLLPESERVAKDETFQPWLELLKKTVGEYKAFLLAVPFARTDPSGETAEVLP